MKKRFLLIFVLLLSGFLLSSYTVKPPTVKTIVIDAGHGGKDPGCHGLLYSEKNIALAVALKLGKYIEDNLKDVKVVYTRKTDVFPSLIERAEIANKAKADLFISIHCNSACYRDKKTKKEWCKPEVQGVETYVMGLSNEKGNLSVAKRENSTILLEKDYEKNYEGFDPNSDEANIIFALYQNAYLENSLNLAAKIQKQYKTRAGRSERGVKRASLLILWKAAMPSLLTEIGFLTSPDEEKFLGSEKGQDYIASSIFRAIREYKNEIEGTTIKYNDDIENQPPLTPSIDTANNNPIILKASIDTSVAPQDTLKGLAKNNNSAAIVKNEAKIKADKEAELKRIEEEKRKAEAKKKEEQAKINEEAKRKEEEHKKADSLAKLKKQAAELEATRKKEEEEKKRKDDETKMKAEAAKKDTVKESVINIPGNNKNIIFRVQVISSEKKLPLNSPKFKDLKDMFEYEMTGVFKYTSGNFPDLTSAVQLQKALREKGFTDAFVVAFHNGKRIPVNDAIKLLKD